MKISTQAFAILLIALVAACATTPDPDGMKTPVEPFDNRSEQTMDFRGDEGELAENLTQDAIAFPELQGIWQGRCLYNDPEGPEEGYVKSVFSFKGNTFKSDTVIYSDENCENVLERGFFHSGSSMQIEGVVSRPAGGVNTVVGTVPFIDLSLDQYMIDNQPVTGSMAAMFSPEIQHDIVFIDGSTFYLGDNSGTLDSSTVQRRPVKLDNDKAFVRQ